MKKEIEKEGKMNEMIVHEERRPDGSLRVSFDYEFCPSLTEQHSAHMTDLNYLIAKFKPDELAAYMAARSQYRQEILGHDFSQEPSLQDAKNIVLEANELMSKLPLDARMQFSSALDFLKFLDNPQNQDILIKSGILEKRDIAPIIGSVPSEPSKVSQNPT